MNPKDVEEQFLFEAKRLARTILRKRGFSEEEIASQEEKISEEAQRLMNDYGATCSEET